MRRLATFATFAIAVGACGAARPTVHAAAPVVAAPAAPTTTAAVPLASFATQYLAIVKPANAALTKADLVLNDNNATQAQQATAVAPVITSWRQADDQLLRVAWPTPTIAADVKTLVAADGSLLGDVQQFGSVTVLGEGTFQTQLASDGGKASAAANIVRADLGLPPSS